MVFNYFKKKNKLNEIINNKPILNLELKITGWEGPFDSELMFRRATEKYNLIKEDYSGHFSLYRIDKNTARLVGGSDEKLHTIKGTIDLNEYNLHIHLSTGWILDLHPNLKGYLNTKISHEPIYTLNGLYDSIFTFSELFSSEPNKKISPNEKKDRKIKSLKEELLKHKNYVFDTITTRKETQIKLLENRYKRLISNQNNHRHEYIVKALSA